MRPVSLEDSVVSHLGDCLVGVRVRRSKPLHPRVLRGHG